MQEGLGQQEAASAKTKARRQTGCNLSGIVTVVDKKAERRPWQVSRDGTGTEQKFRLAPGFSGTVHESEGSDRVTGGVERKEDCMFELGLQPNFCYRVRSRRRRIGGLERTFGFCLRLSRVLACVEIPKARSKTRGKVEGPGLTNAKR
jgi:hypothetical protein